MGESKGSQDDLEQALRPFYQRASEAEVYADEMKEAMERFSQDRLSRLEASLAKEKDAVNKELLKKIRQLESELERTKSEIVSEREKARKFEAENAKNQYRITHLVRSLKDTSI